MPTVLSPERVISDPSVTELEALFAAPAYDPQTPPTSEQPHYDRIFDQVLGRLAAQDVLRQTPGRSEEDGEDDNWIHTQEYSHSTRVISMVGALALEGALHTHEGQVAKETLRERFLSSVAEMVHTDPEFRRCLEINRQRRQLIRGGQVMALDGETRSVDIALRGYKSASAEAVYNPAMGPIAEHNATDVRVAERTERLGVGEGFVGISADLKEAMQLYGEDFYDELGWRKGLVFLQAYFRLDEHTMLAMAYSVDHSDLPLWREVWQEFGGRIPTSESTTTWLDHDIPLPNDPTQAVNFIKAMRARFYQKRGITTKYHCVDTFVADNQDVCDEIFESVYMRLTVADQTHQLDDTLKLFVDGMLQAAHDLNPKVRQHLHKLRHGDQLDSSDISILEDLVRYATVERLRPALAFLGTTRPAKVAALVVPTGLPREAYFIHNLALGVLDGAKANRAYGGCTRTINVGKGKSKTNEDSSLSDLEDPSKMGVEAEDGEDINENHIEEEDENGPLSFDCPKGHKNTRRPGKKNFIKRCRICNVKIMCAPEDIPPKSARRQLFGLRYLGFA